MDEKEIDSAINEQTDKSFQLEHKVNVLLSAAIDMDMDTFEYQLNQYSEQHGLEKNSRRAYIQLFRESRHYVDDQPRTACSGAHL